jgi:hypothetical protein
VKGEELGSGAGREHGSGRLFQLDPLDAVSSKDRDRATVEFLSHGRHD